MTTPRGLLVMLAVCVGPRAAGAANCTDGTACRFDWTPGEPSTLSLDEEVDETVICVFPSDIAYPELVQRTVPARLESLRFCAAESEEEEPARPTVPSFRFILQGDDDASSGAFSFTIDGLEIAATQDRPALHLDGAMPQTDVVVSNVVYQGEGALLRLPSELLDVDVELKRTIAAQGAAVKSCAGQTRVALTVPVDGAADPFSFRSSGERSRPLFYRYCSTEVEDASADLQLSGELELDPNGTAPLTGTEGEAFDSVMLEGLAVVSSGSCDPCVSALESVEVTDTSWSVADAAAAGTWLRSDAGIVHVLDSAWVAAGEPWTIAQGRAVEVLRLDACMSGVMPEAAPPQSMFALTGDGDLAIWNSVVRQMNGTASLVAFLADADARARLRGVTLQTGNVDGTLVPDWSQLDILNTLLIQASSDAGGPVPDGQELPMDVLLVEPSALFAEPDAVAASCEARLIPDRVRTGTRGRGSTTVLIDGIDASVAVLARNELSAFPLDVEPDDPWCDLDGTWPDIGAWSGPLSSVLYAPADPDDARLCPAVADDSGLAVDTGDRPELAVEEFVWGSGCRCSGAGASGAVALFLVPLWWRRRRRTPDSAAS
ncbi:MAG: hypothetical protein VX265_05750 [Myxococcota bacterium]|nr:hypothetical protein [Myxococcota bacterium]